MINEIKGHKGGGGGGHTPVESPDSIQSMAIAKILLALGEGNGLVALMVPIST